MWDQYFPRARVVGLDIVDKKSLNLPSVETYVCDAEDSTSLEFVLKTNGLFPIDIFVDDGGHTMQQQQVTLKTVLPHMREGGIYILEDLHTSYFPSKMQFNPFNTTTTLDILLHAGQRIVLESAYFSEVDGQTLLKRVHHFQFEFRHHKNGADSCACIMQIR